MHAMVRAARAEARGGLVLLCSLAALVGRERAAGAQSRTFTFVNRCSETVWVGALGNPGKTIPNNGGWRLDPGASSSVGLPGGWAGRFWGRRGCSFDGNGNGTCATGDCGNRLQCGGAGGVPPTSLAEFTLNGSNNTDFYDVSLVDGYDFAISVQPVPANTSPGNPYQCGTPTCTNDLLATCPEELKKRVGGRVVACRSACEAFNTDYYCCRGAYGTPQTCQPSQWPVNYAAIFKRACPTQYSYAYDDQLSTFVCNNPNPNYTITFCPSGGAPPPPPPPPPDDGIQPGAWYTMTNQGNGLCVDDSGNRQVDGNPVVQWTCHNQENQQWQFVATGGGYYGVISRRAPWQTLDVTGGAGATGDGAKIQLWGWGPPGGANQQWKPVSLGGGRYKLIARHSGKCLDVPGQTTELGVQLQQWTCNGTVAQSFQLTRR